MTHFCFRTSDMHRVCLSLRVCLKLSIWQWYRVRLRYSAIGGNGTGTSRGSSPPKANGGRIIAIGTTTVRVLELIAGVNENIGFSLLGDEFAIFKAGFQDANGVVPMAIMRPPLALVWLILSTVD